MSYNSVTDYQPPDVLGIVIVLLALTILIYAWLLYDDDKLRMKALNWMQEIWYLIKGVFIYFLGCIIILLLASVDAWTIGVSTFGIILITIGVRMRYQHKLYCGFTKITRRKDGNSK